jgi:hypothetical protein
MLRIWGFSEYGAARPFGPEMLMKAGLMGEGVFDPLRSWASGLSKSFNVGFASLSLDLGLCLSLSSRVSKLATEELAECLCYD